MLLVTATDLYASRREGAGRAREDPGAPGTGRGWSTGCLAEEGSLKINRQTQNMSYNIVYRTCIRNRKTETMQ